MGYSKTLVMQQTIKFPPSFRGLKSGSRCGGSPHFNPVSFLRKNLRIFSGRVVIAFLLTCLTIIFMRERASNGVPSISELLQNTFSESELNFLKTEASFVENLQKIREIEECLPDLKASLGIGMIQLSFRLR
jgi:hypothetical protein